MRRILLMLLAMAALVVVSGGVLAAPPVTVTDDFSGGAITIDDASDVEVGRATPYPSGNTVSGFPEGSRIKNVNLSLNGFSHAFPSDVDVLLASPSGKSAILMSDAGSSAFPVSGLNIVLDDAAVSPLPADSSLGQDGSTVTYQPVNYAPLESFPSPAPTPGKKGTSLSVFNGTDPNGEWQLFVIDDAVGDVGSITSWTLTITARG